MQGAICSFVIDTGVFTHICVLFFSFDMKIFQGTSHPQLAKSIADHLGQPLTDVEVTSFPDGESFVRIHENIRGEDVFIVQPTCPPTNHHLMELLIMVDAARRASPKQIVAVIPFYGYARQDRKDQPRVPITAKLVANLLAAAGVDRVVAVDLHAPQIQGFFDIPVDHLYAKPVFVKHLRSLPEIENLVVVSPDVGGLKMSQGYANALGADLAMVAKQRVDSETVKALAVIGDVEGRDVLLVDDMTETAGTITAAAAILQEKGARSIRAAVTHGVLGEKAHQRLADSFITELLTTDSVPMAKGEKVTVLSIAPLMAETIKRIHYGESVTSLFEV